MRSARAASFSSSAARAEAPPLQSEGSVSDYIGEVLFVDGDLLEFAGREAYCQVSLMGGEEFNNATMVGISVFS